MVQRDGADAGLPWTLQVLCPNTVCRHVQHRGRGEYETGSVLSATVRCSVRCDGAWVRCWLKPDRNLVRRDLSLAAEGRVK